MHELINRLIAIHGANCIRFVAVRSSGCTFVVNRLFTYYASLRYGDSFEIRENVNGVHESTPRSRRLTAILYGAKRDEEGYLSVDSGPIA